MLRIPKPRPWTPLRRRRFEIAHAFVPRTGTSVPRTAHHGVNREPDDGLPRAASPVQGRTQRRGLFRRAPSARELRQRLDELTADAEAWIAELENDSNPPSH